jgi:hypothetical protein
LLWLHTQPEISIWLHYLDSLETQRSPHLQLEELIQPEHTSVEGADGRPKLREEGRKDPGGGEREMEKAAEKREKEGGEERRR